MTSTVVATRHSAEPIDAVWARLADARRWREWTAFSVSELEREGEPAPDGVGAIRLFGFRAFTSREEVVAFEPPSHLGYVLLKGLPLRGYRSDVALTAVPGGTDIEWRSTFESAWPGTGWFWRGFLALVLRDCARRLAQG